MSEEEFTRRNVREPYTKHFAVKTNDIQGRRFVNMYRTRPDMA